MLIVHLSCTGEHTVPAHNEITKIYQNHNLIVYHVLSYNLPKKNEMSVFVVEFLSLIIQPIIVHTFFLRMALL